MPPDATTGAIPTPTLADFTSVGMIVPALQSRDVAGVIQELAMVMQREGRVPDLLPFYHAALNREFLVSTGMEAGMAFPHARLPGLKDLSFAFGRSPIPLPWGGGSTRSVKLVFLIAVPATEATQQFLLLGGLARLSTADQLLEKLLSASDSAQIFGLFRQVSLRTVGKSSSLVSSPSTSTGAVAF